MPKTIKERVPRIAIRIPKPMSDEIDRIVKKLPVYGNRQQFVEMAVREKLEKAWKVEARLQGEA